MVKEKKEWMVVYTSPEKGLCKSSFKRKEWAESYAQEKIDAGRKRVRIKETITTTDSVWLRRHSWVTGSWQRSW